MLSACCLRRCRNILPLYKDESIQLLSFVGHGSTKSIGSIYLGSGQNMPRFGPDTVIGRFKTGHLWALQNQHGDGCTQNSFFISLLSLLFVLQVMVAVSRCSTNQCRMRSGTACFEALGARCISLLFFLLFPGGRFGRF